MQFQIFPIAAWDIPNIYDDMNGMSQEKTCWPTQNSFQHRWSHRIACWVNNDKISHPACYCWKTRHKRLCSTSKGLLISQQLSLGTAAPSFLGNFCRSVAKSCPTTCDPIDCSRPGFPVLQYFPEFAQIHIHCIGMLSDNLILCCPLLLPSIFPSISW